MTTGLWIAASGLEGSALLENVPPECRRSVDPAHAVTMEASDGDVLLTSPAWPVAGARHFVPSLAALIETPYSARLELSVQVAGRWSAWAAGVGLGPVPFSTLPPVVELEADIDVFSARVPVQAARLRARLHDADVPAVLAAPWMLALSASDLPVARSAPAPTGVGARLDVPVRSQMDADPEIARRICSPTCVAMVLDFWGRPGRLEALAAEMFNAAAGLYGVWPSAVLAAGRRGLAGYVLRFPDWAAAAWCLHRGLPVIASVRYAAGELTGAAVPQTGGHLVTLTGWEGDEALVNDPGAPSAASVARRYRLDELARVWLERTGVGYVLFPPPTGTLRGG